MFTPDCAGNIVPVYSQELQLFTLGPFSNVVSIIGVARCNETFTLTNPYTMEYEIKKLYFNSGELYDIVVLDTGEQCLHYKDTPLYLTVVQDYFDILPTNFTSLPESDENPINLLDAPIWGT